LERRKWVSRRASGSDARSHSLHLAADGEKVLAKIKSLAEQHEAQLAEHVGAKRRQQLMGSAARFRLTEGRQITS
jgi:DNA-binding MarR family transcriptional regulator